jgi:hypothetical protein
MRKMEISWKTLAALLIATVFLYDGVKYISGKQPYNDIPRDKNIQKGFVKPSKLEIELHNQDEFNGNETVMRYDDQTYLLKLDENGEPILEKTKKPIEDSPIMDYLW